MAAAAFLSMWISNTATSLMLLPIALATLENVREQRLKIGLLLGICYACNVGGIGTPIGTPPNLIFMQVYQENTGIGLTFLDWMGWGFPPPDSVFTARGFVDYARVCRAPKDFCAGGGRMEARRETYSCGFCNDGVSLDVPGRPYGRLE
ncbi:MAG: hypothetical protein CM1200mP36_08240 [Gammaproteobacteria bacterium]|nr:MAG: hypothetical protein CM1200mP36_08240 [Gammaproteobacteria bacterium]